MGAVKRKENEKVKPTKKKKKSVNVKGERKKFGMRGRDEGRKKGEESRLVKLSQNQTIL